jgi:hypothetical protein
MQIVQWEMMISEKVLQDTQAISVAEALAMANEAAKAAGVYNRPVRLVIEEKTNEAGTVLWRINYIPVPPAGTFLRGGDFLVDVDTATGTIYQAQHGQ